MISVVILLINKLGYCSELDICCALINGTCKWRQNKVLQWIPAVHNMVSFVKIPLHSHEYESAAFTMRRQVGLLCSSVCWWCSWRIGEVKWRWWKEMWYFPWLCVGIITHWGIRQGEFLQSLITATAISISLRSTLVQTCDSYTWLPPALMKCVLPDLVALIRV